MTIYPAIDILDKECVRLQKGEFSRVSVYAGDPADVAKRWEAEGGEYLHVVDLDGAKSGAPVNHGVIAKILKSINIPVQLGGGIRDMETISMYVAMGVSRVIIGTKALQSPDFLAEAVDKFGDKIAVGIDAKNGFVATSGWVDVSNRSAVDFAKTVYEMGVKTIIYTDIDTDGMLTGPNLSGLREMVNSAEADIIASGGISSYKDIENVRASGASGVIIGKALYTGDVDLQLTMNNEQ